MISPVRAGEKIATRPLNEVIAAVNRMESELVALRKFALGRQSGTSLIVINKTGRELLHGEVAPYDIGEAQPYDNPQRLLPQSVAVLREPDANEDWSNWVIIGERIPDGLSGSAYDSGTILARLRPPEDGVDDANRCCDLSFADGGAEKWWHLKRIPIGPARILWEAEDDTDDFRWALVRFGGHDAYPVLYQVTDSGDGSGSNLQAQRVLSDGSLYGQDEEFIQLPGGST